MKYYQRVWILCLMLIALLMGMHFLPRITVFGITLKKVNLLSDLFPDTPDVSDKEYDDAFASLHALSSSAKSGSCPKGVTCIEDYSTALQGGMPDFYQKLIRLSDETSDSATVRSSSQVRIAFFGDSFIEGDILTGDLRDMLQQHYGGSGVGFVDMASQTAGFRQTVTAHSKQIIRHSATDSAFQKNHLGINSRYFKPLPGSAMLTLATTDYGRCTRKVHQSQLFLTTHVPLQVSACINNAVQQKFQLPASSSVQCVTAKGDIEKITWMMQADSSQSDRITLYGATMDNPRGVVLDNFSLRGSTGSNLLQIPEKNIRDFVSLRPYDLIVLHFGLNAIAENSTREDVSRYGRTLDRIIIRLKELMPHTPILMVSVSDRDVRRTDGSLTTMPPIRWLVREQQQVAMQHKIAFWNLYQAMGGSGSMGHMAAQSPPLANKDYTHLNFRGGRKIAKKLYEALLHAVEQEQNHLQ